MGESKKSNKNKNKASKLNRYYTNQFRVVYNNELWDVGHALNMAEHKLIDNKFVSTLESGLERLLYKSQFGYYVFKMEPKYAVDEEEVKDSEFPEAIESLLNPDMARICGGAQRQEQYFHTVETALRAAVANAYDILAFDSDEAYDNCWWDSPDEEEPIDWSKIGETVSKIGSLPEVHGEVYEVCLEKKDPGELKLSTFIIVVFNVSLMPK